MYPKKYLDIRNFISSFENILIDVETEFLDEHIAHVVRKFLYHDYPDYNEIASC